METSRKRIIYFIEKQSIKPKDFLDKTGVSKGFIDRSHQNSGASDIHLSKILEAYPDLNPEWLVTGKGEMIRPTTPQSHFFKQEETEDDGVLLLKEKIKLLEKSIKLLEENKELQQKVIGQLEKELAAVKQQTKTSEQ